MTSLDVWRSWLYVPGDRPERIDKALASDADCVIIDLEDAVAPSNKALARDSVRDVAGHGQSKPVLVRVNASGTEDQELDIDALQGLPAVRGVRIPKCENAAQITAIAEQLPKTELHLLVESAKGLQAVDELAVAHPGVATIALGEADLRADMRITDESYLGYARGRVVAAAAAAQLIAPPQSVYTNIDDLDGLRATSLQAKAAGFFGRTVIHPKQIEIVNTTFLPSTADVDQARALVEALDARTDQAAFVLPDGRFVDPAVARSAREILHLATTFGTSDASTKGAK